MEPSAQRILKAESSTLRSGGLRNELSTVLVRLYRQIFGRGPVRTATYEFDAGFVTFLRDVLVPHERFLVCNGRGDLVRETRAAARNAEREQLISEVERLTGRPVLADFFQVQPERDLAVELFWVPKPGADDAGSNAAHQVVPTNGTRSTKLVSGGEGRDSRAVPTLRPSPQSGSPGRGDGVRGEIDR